MTLRYIVGSIPLLPYSVALYISCCQYKEKIVQAKSHVASIRFIDALRAVARINILDYILAGWLDLRLLREQYFSGSITTENFVMKKLIL